MSDLEALERYGDVLKLNAAERILIEFASKGFKLKDLAEGLYFSPSQASRVYHNARIKLETAIKIENWLKEQPVPNPSEAEK